MIAYAKTMKYRTKTFCDYFPYYITAYERITINIKTTTVLPFFLNKMMKKL